MSENVLERDSRIYNDGRSKGFNERLQEAGNRLHRELHGEFWARKKADALFNQGLISSEQKSRVYSSHQYGVDKLRTIQEAAELYDIIKGINNPKRLEKIIGQLTKVNMLGFSWFGRYDELIRPMANRIIEQSILLIRAAYEKKDEPELFGERSSIYPNWDTEVQAEVYAQKWHVMAELVQMIKDNKKIDFDVNWFYLMSMKRIIDIKEGELRAVP